MQSLFISDGRAKLRDWLITEAGRPLKGKKSTPSFVVPSACEGKDGKKGIERRVQREGYREKEGYRERQEDRKKSRRYRRNEGGKSPKQGLNNAQNLKIILYAILLFPLYSSCISENKEEIIYRIFQSTNIYIHI